MKKPTSKQTKESQRLIFPVNHVLKICLRFEKNSGKNAPKGQRSLTESVNLSKKSARIMNDLTAPLVKAMHEKGYRFPIRHVRGAIFSLWIKNQRKSQAGGDRPKTAKPITLPTPRRLTGKNCPDVGRLMASAVRK